jgi:hypothetical protein
MIFQSDAKSRFIERGDEALKLLLLSILLSLSQQALLIKTYGFKTEKERFANHFIFRLFPKIYHERP